jgi:outer membrane immunogenic protein
MFAVTAASADGPSYGLKDSRAHERPFSWAGLYVGAAAGYGFGATTFDDPLGRVEDGKLSGAQGIVSAGYDVQLGQSVVVGVLTDFAFGKVDGDMFASNEHISIDRQFAIGARLGYIVSPKSLWFATAGWTRAKFEDADFPQINSSVHGFFIGGGVEQALTSNLSLKLEYRFSDYKAFSDPVAVDEKYDNDVHSVRLGVNYKFGR